MPKPGLALAIKQLASAAVILCSVRANFAQDQAAAANSADDEVVMVVGDRKITAAEFEKILSALPPQFQDSLARLGKRGFAEQLSNLLSLTMEAEKRKLDQSEEFQRMVEFDRRVLLAQLTMNQIAEELAPVSDEEVEYYYQTHKDDYEQLKVTGIYVPFVPPGRAISINTPSINSKPQYTEQQAQQKAMELRARINSGQSMGLLAKAESAHPTAAKNGDFGFIGHSYSDLDPKLVAAIFALQPRMVSAPLKDKAGFYLFRVETTRTQPLEEVETDIRRSLSILKVGRRMEALQENYPVKLDTKYFGEPSAAQPSRSDAPPASSMPPPPQ